MKSKLLSMMSLSALTLVLSVSAVACGPGKIFKQLDLSEDQKTQMRTLHAEKKSMRESNKKQRQEMKDQHIALFDNYSEQQAEDIATRAGEMKKQRVINRLQHMQKMLAILDNEQKQKFKQLMIKKAEHGHGEKMRHHFEG